MKYLKKFSTESEYQTFKNSDDWVKPNLSAIVEPSPVIIFNGVHFNLQFPVTLIEGENGELGIALYNFLLEKYGTVTSHQTVPETFILHLENYGVVNEVTSNKISTEINGYCLYHSGGAAWVLYPNGDLHYDSYEPV